MTEWERTGDTKWRDKIFAGIDSIKAMPYWFKTSPSLVWGFFPDTDKLVPRQNVMGGYNLVTNMGGPEVMFELNQFIDRPDWVTIWLQYCRLSTAPADVVMRDKTTGNEGPNGQYAGGGRMAAYAYLMTKDKAYAARAMGGIVGGGGSIAEAGPEGRGHCLVDSGVVVDGYYGDAAITVPVGAIDAKAARLLKATEESLKAGIAAVRPGATLGDVGAAVQNVVEGEDFQWCGILWATGSASICTKIRRCRILAKRARA